MSSFMAKTDEVERRWHLIDANGQVLGRLAVQIAKILMGKTKPEYTPHTDTGDFVVVVNCEKVRLTGRKLETMTYEHFTGYAGGLKVRAIKDILQKKPEMVLREAVRRMMPKSNLGRHQLHKLKLFVGPNHTHQAQQPVPFDLKMSTK
jgi:large subunit ribosomal protein L13